MATVGGIKVSATGASRLHRNVWRSGALGAFGGDGAEFFDGEEVFFAADSLLGCYEVFEGDDAIGATFDFEGLGCFFEPLEIANAENSGEYVDHTGIGFQIEILQRCAGCGVSEKRKPLWSHPVFGMPVLECAAEFLDILAREHGAEVKVACDE